MSSAGSGCTSTSVSPRISDLPYSQASRTLFPLWEELAEATKEREDVVIARIDASANDINMSVQGSYPSLCLFPALHAERVCSVCNSSLWDVLCDSLFSIFNDMTV